jgi:exodeoxyribonuclease V gamma subunit
VFELNNLDKFFVNQEWVARELNADETEINLDTKDTAFLKRLKAEGRWPPGPLGEKLFTDMNGEISSFISKIRSLNVGEKLDDRFIDYQIGEGKNRYQLIGKLQSNFQNGNLLYRYARSKPRDQLAAWLNHLITLNDGVRGIGSNTTYLMQMDEFCKFTAVEGAKTRLIDILEIYREAQTTLSQFILPAAFSWVEFNQKPSSRSKKTPQQVALEAFNKDLTYDSYWQLLFRNGNAETLFDSESFQRSMSLIVEPLLENKQAIVY